MENLSNIFKEKNLKLTPQRYAIYNYLKSTKSHPSAEVIYENLREINLYFTILYCNYTKNGV